MLIFPLKKEWYEKIRSGEKRIEYRERRSSLENLSWSLSREPVLPVVR